MKLTPILTLGTFVVFAAGTLDLAAAADPASKEGKAPLDQAIESVDKNLQKNPQNPGLTQASERLQSNQQQIEQRRQDQAQRHPRFTERPSRAEHPGGARH